MGVILILGGYMKKILKIAVIVLAVLLIIILGEFIYYKQSYKRSYKEDHKPLYIILSDGGMECGYVQLIIYDDNTYAFYNEQVLKSTSDDAPDVIDYEDNPTVGTYNYDFEKVIDSVKSTSENERKSKYVYIVEDPEGTKYYVGSSNKQFKKFLHSIFLQKFRVNLNTCPEYK